MQGETAQEAAARAAQQVIDRIVSTDEDGQPRVVHCWEDGPRDDDTPPSSCMLLDGHAGPHEFTPDADITVQFR